MSARRTALLNWEVTLQDKKHSVVLRNTITALD